MDQEPAGLHPPPVNLAEHFYLYNRLAFALVNGVDGTSMPAWRDMSDIDLSALAEAVRAFHVEKPEAPVSKEVLDLGERVYRANCAQCHGPTGAGDGSAVSELRIVPANLSAGRASLELTLRLLRNGIDGTQMAPWTDRLSDA